MKKRSFTFPSLRLYAVFGFVGLLIFVYLFQAGRSLVAMAYYQQFTAATAPGVVTMTTAQQDAARRLLTAAIRLNDRNPHYHHALGNFLFQLYDASSLPEMERQREDGLQAAETSLKTALWLDPGSAWNYYELGRLEEVISPCDDLSMFDASTSCPGATFFVSALQHAPNHLFLRKSVGLWLYYRSRETAFQIIRDVIAFYTKNPQKREVEFSKFLYDMQLDYESDRYGPVKSIDDPKILSERCLQDASSACFPIPELEGEGIECHSDAGTAAWRAFLNSDAMRIKKIICVPPHLDEYTSASLNVLMNNGGNGNFTARFYLDEQLIKQYDATDPIPRTAAWYEIPFDIHLLQGKSNSYVTIYVRVAGVSHVKNYLQIWGTQDEPTSYSVFNFNTTEDLSLEQGTQTGEYMIRLRLRK